MSAASSTSSLRTTSLVKKYGIKLTILAIILESFGSGIAQLSLDKRCQVDHVLSGFMMAFGMLLVFVIFLFFFRDRHELNSRVYNDDEEGGGGVQTEEEEKTKFEEGKRRNKLKIAEWKINLLYFIIFCNMATTIASSMLNLFHSQVAGEQCWQNKAISLFGFALLAWVTFLIVWFGMDVQFV